MSASPSRSDSASGTANGGSSLPASTPREPGPSVVERVVGDVGDQGQRQHADDRPRPLHATARGRLGRTPHGGAALGQHEHRRQHDQHAEQRHRQVDHRDEAEVAQHPHVRQREHGEAGDRRRARGEHRGAGRAVGAADRLGRRVAGRALGLEARRQQHRELGRDRQHERAEHRRQRVERHAQQPQHERRPAGGERDRHDRHPRAVPRAAPRAARPAAHEQQDEQHRQQADHERPAAPQRVRQRRVRLGGRARAGRPAGRSRRAAGRAARAGRG